MSVQDSYPSHYIYKNLFRGKFCTAFLVHISQEIQSILNARSNCLGPHCAEKKMETLVKNEIIVAASSYICHWVAKETGEEAK